jgi:NitT/TauT family transport system substrate-binding protein
MGKLGKALVAAVAATILLGGQAHADVKKITIGDVGSGSSLHWPAYIAMSKGLFEKAGIAIEYIPVQTSAGVFQQLSAGSLDLGSGGFPDPLRAIDKGGAITIFRTEGIPSPYELMVKPTIKSYADLKGKVVMIDTPKGNTRLYLERMITPNGLKYGDFDLVFAGATAARFQALASGAVDATLVNPPYNFKARALGFNSLGASGPRARDVPFNGYAASIAWAKQNRPALDAFLSAYQKGVDWFYDKANRNEAIDILVKFAKLDRVDCEQTYDLYQQLKIYDRIGAIAGSGLDNLIRIMKADGDLEGSTDLARFADASIVTPK